MQLYLTAGGLDVGTLNLSHVSLFRAHCNFEQLLMTSCKLRAICNSQAALPSNGECYSKKFIVVNNTIGAKLVKVVFFFTQMIQAYFR